MKKIISLVIVSLMLVTLAVGVSADAGRMHVECYFKDMADFMNYFIPGAFFIPDGESQVFGYSEAKALQSNFESSDDLGFDGFKENDRNAWLRYDCEIKIAMAPDGDADSLDRGVMLVYCNNNPLYMGLEEGVQYVEFAYSVAKEELSLRTGPAIGISDSDTVIATYPMKLDSESGNVSYRFGMSVDENRIRCFIDGKKVIDVYDPQYYWGTYDGSCFLLWNESNMVVLNDYKVSTPGFLFPYEEEPAPTEPAPTEPITSVSSSVSEVVVTVTNEKGEVETDEKGEVKTEVSEVIVTEIVTVAPADTQNGGGGGGTATRTGDSAFIVAAAAVIALGSAVIVKKVTAK